MNTKRFSTNNVNNIIIMIDAAYILSNLLGFLISIISIYLGNKIE